MIRPPNLVCESPNGEHPDEARHCASRPVDTRRGCVAQPGAVWCWFALFYDAGFEHLHHGKAASESADSMGVDLPAGRPMAASHTARSLFASALGATEISSQQVDREPARERERE